jgi:hypothetical protein
VPRSNQLSYLTTEEARIFRSRRTYVKAAFDPRSTGVDVTDAHLWTNPGQTDDRLALNRYGVEWDGIYPKPKH